MNDAAAAAKRIHELLPWNWRRQSIVAEPA